MQSTRRKAGASRVSLKAQLPSSKAAAGKRPFDIDEVMRKVRTAVRPYPKAALFELADEGFRSPFEQLLACLISIRTRDEVTLVTARRLFAAARTPEEIQQLTPKKIDELIRACRFHEAKAYQIHEIAQRILSEHNGTLPCDVNVLRSFHGVGPKCAHLVLGIACKQPYISVDIHVHRITSRWGFVSAKTPEQTMVELEERLPRRYWVEINRLLVPFGKHICTGVMPRCSTCPILDMCRQVGVMRHA